MLIKNDQGLSAPAPGQYTCIYPPFSKIFFSNSGWPIKAKFYAEPPMEGGKKLYMNSPGHMNKIAAMPLIIWLKPSKIFSYRTNSPIIMNLDIEHNELKLNTVYI